MFHIKVEAVGNLRAKITPCVDVHGELQDVFATPSAESLRESVEAVRRSAQAIRNRVEEHEELKLQVASRLNGLAVLTEAAAELAEVVEKHQDRLAYANRTTVAQELADSLHSIEQLRKAGVYW